MGQVAVKADMTGVVCKVLVKPGDRVAEFDPLVMVESMKMEIPLAAPRAGTVDQVQVAEGEMVNEGDVAVTLAT